MPALMDVQAILHSVPRFTWSLESTNNAWQPPENWDFWKDLSSKSPPYEQSMQVLLLSPLIFLFSAWFLYQCIVCSINFCKSSERVHIGRLKPCVRCWLMVMLAVALGAMISVVVYTILLGKQFLVIEKWVNKSYVPYHNAMTNTTTILSLLNNSSSVLNSLDESGVNISDIEGSFEMAFNELNKYYSVASDIDWTFSEEDKAYQRKVFRDVSLLWLFLCVLLFVLTWFRGWLYGKYCCGLYLWFRLLFCLVLLVGIIIIIGLVAAQFALSVQVADVCDDFAGSVHKVINQTENPSSSDVALYYIYCDGRFDYREDLQNGYELLLNNSDAVFSCVEHVNSSSAFNNSTKYMAMELWSLYQETITKSGWLVYTGTDCNATGIHKNCLEVEDLVCTSALNDWCLLWLLQLLTGCFLIFSNCFFHSCCRKQEFAKPLTERFVQTDYYARVDDGAVILKYPPFPETGEVYSGSPSNEKTRSQQGLKAEVQTYVSKLRSVSSTERELYAEKLKSQGFSCYAVEKAMAILRREGELNDTLQQQW